MQYFSSVCFTVFFAAGNEMVVVMMSETEETYYRQISLGCAIIIEIPTRVK